MKKSVCAILCFLIIGGLSACSSQKEIEQDLTASLNEIRTGTLAENSYIYSSNLGIANDNNYFNSNEITQKIASNVHFTITDISQNEESAEADIEFSAPDVYQMIEEIASTMQEENVEKLLEALDTQLDGDFPTKEFEVTVDLRRMNDHWYLIPNSQLANAFSGGLIEQYSLMGQNIVDELLEGDKDE